MRGFRPKPFPSPGPKKPLRPQPLKQSNVRQHLQNILPRLAWPLWRRQWNPYLHSDLPAYRKWWWFLTKTPKLLITVAVASIRHPVMRMLFPQPREEEQAPHSSALGLLLYNMLAENDQLHIALDEAIRPWGHMPLLRGPSMRPTFSGDREFGYSSFNYIMGRNCRPGDVVSILAEGDPRRRLGKRIRALGGESFVQKSGLKFGGRFKETVRESVPQGYCYFLGDNTQNSSDSRRSGATPLINIFSKQIWVWGAHGFSWVDHTLQPWLEPEVKKPQRPTRPPPARAAPSQQLPRKQGEAKLPAVRALPRTKVLIPKHDPKNLKVVVPMKNDTKGR